MSNATIQFLGATGTVTGSKYLLSIAGKKILVDCGLFQGLKNLRLRNWNPLPIDPKDVDIIILTHAHIDHSGYLPRMLKMGFSGQIYATHGTKKLAGIMLPDAAYLQQEEAKFLNAHKLSKHKPAEPLYDIEDADRAVEFIRGQDWNTPIKIADNITIEFFAVSHLLGASAVRIEFFGQTITFSGDVGRDNDPLLKQKSKLKDTDYLVVESTYGEGAHPDGDPYEELADIINNTAKRGGSVIIPTFAVGRAQNILYYITKLRRENRIPDLPIYLNSPMAIQASRAYQDFGTEFKIPKKELDQIFAEVHLVKDVEESKHLNTKPQSAIILSSSGMMVGGRILHLLTERAPNPSNSIIIVGFQAAGTRGEALVRGKRELKIFGSYVPINAELHFLETLSGHADGVEIANWLESCHIKPKKCFVTHGEPIRADEMRKRLEEKFEWNCIVPDYLETYEL